MHVKEIGCEDVGCIHLSQDRDQWWFFMNVVIRGGGISWQVERLLATPEELFSIELVNNLGMNWWSV